MAIKTLNSKSEKTKQEIAYIQIKELIIKNKIQPNTLLVERQLSEEFGVSRTPIREALNKLTSEGLTELIPGKGVFVSSVTFEDFINIYEVREALEGMAAKLCTLKRNESTLKKLNKNIESFEKTINMKDYDAAIEYDLIFHRIVIRGANNPKLETLLNGIYDQINRFAFTTASDIKRQEYSLNQHTKIYEAIRDNDAELAEKLTRDHIINVKEYHIKEIYLYNSI